MSEKKSQGTLRPFDLFTMALGPSIGSGFMVLTGIAIGITGRSVNIAYILATIFAVFMLLPYILIPGTAKFNGGQYSQIGVLGGKTMSGIFIYLNIAMSIGIASSALSFAHYCISLVPHWNPKIISFVMMTVLLLVNLTSVKNASKLQNILAILLLLAVALFIGFGFRNIQPGYFQPPNFMPGGILGLLHASLFLTLPFGGIAFVSNFSSQAKDPVRDIPRVIAAAMLSVCIIFALGGTVGAGVLPLAQVVNQPLSTVAKTFMPTPAFLFFVVGGAMFGLLTAINTALGAQPYPIITASEDGWIPELFGKRGKRFGTPYVALITIYFIVMIPILLDVDLATVVNSMGIMGMSSRILTALSAMNQPKVLPELWKRNPMYMEDGKLRFFCILSIIANLCAMLLMIFTKTKWEIIANLIILSVVILLTLLRRKHVTIHPSYEAN